MGARTRTLSRYTNYVPEKSSPGQLQQSAFSHNSAIDDQNDLARITKLAIEVFSDAEIAKEWLTNPNLAMLNITPIQLILSPDQPNGYLIVETLLHRIDHGILA
jgi:putative toxin-antitoxin system antitoxin component (TIGR02293 family)